MQKYKLRLMTAFYYKPNLHEHVLMCVYISTWVAACCVYTLYIFTDPLKAGKFVAVTK